MTLYAFMRHLVSLGILQILYQEIHLWKLFINFSTGLSNIWLTFVRKGVNIINNKYTGSCYIDATICHFPV